MDLTTTPLSVYLPFNRDCLRGAFVPAKGGAEPPERHGQWLLVQEQALLVRREGDTFGLPAGGCPAELDGHLDAPLWLGTLHGAPCWVASVAPDAPVPAGLCRETLTEFAPPELPILLVAPDGRRRETRLGQLFPEPFRLPRRQNP